MHLWELYIITGDLFIARNVSLENKYLKLFTTCRYKTQAEVNKETDEKM